MAGHSWADVQGYTLSQIELFLTAVSRCDRQRMREAMLAYRGARTSKSDFKKLLRELDK